MWELYDVTLLVNCLFQILVMNFVDFVFNCYTHITSHVIQAFASCTHYTSYSLLNIVHVIVCVSRSNQPSLQLLWVFVQNIFCIREFKGRLFENLNFGKTGFKTCVFEKFCITYSCILLIFLNAWRILCKNWAVFLKLCFSWNFDRTRLFLDQLKLVQNF